MDLWLPNRLYMLHMWSSESEPGAPLSWRPDPLSAMREPRATPQGCYFALFQLAGINSLESNNYWIQSRKFGFQVKILCQNAQNPASTAIHSLIKPFQGR